MKVVILILSTCLLSIANGRKNKPLPFTCPEDVKGGIDPINDPSVRRQLDSSTYFEYRAALALVPCSATALQAFVEDNLNTEFTVAVAFIYDQPIEDLKYWLE